jgi:hypothetical protein
MSLVAKTMQMALQGMLQMVAKTAKKMVLARRRKPFTLENTNIANLMFFTGKYITI